MTSDCFSRFFTLIVMPPRSVFSLPLTVSNILGSSRRFLRLCKRRLALWAAACLAPALTACPHHLEKMVEQMAPPKGYKPSYTTQSSSFKKLLEQHAPQNSSDSARKPERAGGFDPSILSSFPYSSPQSAGGASDVLNDISKGLPQNTPQDITKNVPQNLPKGSPEDLAKIFSQGFPKGIPSDMAESLKENMATIFSGFPLSADSLTKAGAFAKEFLGDSALAGVFSGGANGGETMKRLLGDSVFAGGFPSLGGLAGLPDSLTAGISQEELRARAAAMAPSPYAERSQRERFEKIAQAEEEDARRIAAMPAIMPVNVNIRSIDDSRYPDEISLAVTVTDTSGRYISGLAPPNFQGEGSYRAYWRALTDSCPQMTSAAQTRVRSFDVQEISDDSRESHAVAFVLDHSPSMGDMRARRLQEAVARTMGIIKKQDYVTAIKFTRRVKIEVPLTNDTNAYRENFLIDGLEGYDGGTAIYDAVIAAVKELNRAPVAASKTLILFTDGGDNSSKARLNAAYTAAKENGVRIYSIAYGDVEERPLRNLAQYTGGAMYRLYSVREFPLAFADLYTSLKNYYRVRYRPPDCAALHTVNVRLTVPELATVSTGTAQYDRSVFTPLDTVGSANLVNIEFETGKSTIQAVSLPIINNIAQYLKQNPNVVMEIRGHTDNRGAAELNQKLSEARAAAVVEALLGMGVAKKQVRSIGFGASKPIAPNDSEQNRRKNRRTEFAIVGAAR